MQNSHLSQLLNALPNAELREARKFVYSPFFNNREDLQLLFDYLSENKAPEKEDIWRHVCPGEPFDDQKLRLLVSYLHKLLEQYIAIKEYTADEWNSSLHLVAGFRRRGLSAAFDRAAKQLEKRMENQPLRDARFYQIQHLLQKENYQTAIAENPSNTAPLRSMIESMDIYYLSERLRLICLAAAQHGVYQADFQADIELDIIALAEKKDWKNRPAIAIYLHAYRMLEQPEEEAHFKALKKMLLEKGAQFGLDEIRELYLLAINYCIRRLNDGGGFYAHEVLELYKEGLKTGYLLENGQLSRFTYHNIVAAGLKSGDLDWVSYFIYAYKNSLERTYRDSSFSFNLARLEYDRRHYDAVLELLQKANYRDPLLNLAAKTLLLKTWYELEEFDLLQSHLDAMRNYIRRKKVIGYHRSNYLNIVKYAEKLLKLNYADNKVIQQLKKDISEEEILSEREWFLGCIG